MSTRKTVGAYEAKTNLSALLELVRQGHEIVITRHERPVARLVPVGPSVARSEVFTRVRALRGRLHLRAGEKVSGLISAGRRL